MGRRVTVIELLLTLTMSDREIDALMLLSLLLSEIRTLLLLHGTRSRHHHLRVNLRGDR